MSPASGTPRAAELLARARELFQRLGLPDEGLEVVHRGRRFRIQCDPDAFVVRRLATSQGVPPGVSGWVVCRVDATGCFEECSAPGLGEDPLGCELSFDDWLELAAATRG